MATSNRYEFQPPMNMHAIRSNIMQRIKQRNEYSKQPLTPPSSIASKHEIQYLSLDNGLPSPPIESFTFDDEDDSTTFEMATSSNNDLPDSPPSPVMSLSKSSSSSSSCSLSATEFESSDAIREKIRILKEEKHRLFQTMKDLLSQPAQIPTQQRQSSVALDSIDEKPITTHQPNAKPVVERSRSQSRDNSLKSRPIIRSRSISHTEFSRPISRYNNYYHERRSPPRFYGNDNRNYPYNSNRSSYPHTSLQQSQNQNASSSSSTSPSLNMSRRVLNSNNINNNNNNNTNNNNSSYVSSRSQLAGRPSSSSSSAAAAAAAAVIASASASASTSTTFRPLNRPSSDRHSRY